MSRADEIYSKIANDGETAIDEFIADFQSENLWLDFKRSADAGAGSKLHVSDRENLAKAISGFGNSDGGVIVWGVDCRRDPVTNADVPQKKVPIENPQRFVSWLENATTSCTAPPHPSVEHIAIRNANSTDSYVATLISSSSHAPHQCIQPTSDLRYYIRVGSNFSGVPHAVLSGLFGRRPQPRVTFKWLAPSLAVNNVDVVTISATVSLTNTGRAIARDLYLGIWACPPGPNSGVTFGRVNDERWERYDLLNLWNVISREGVRVAPGAPAPVGVFELLIKPPFLRPYSFSASAGCEGGERWESRTDIAPDEMADLYSRALVSARNGTSAGTVYDAILTGNA
jgi:Putative DNA-binding domain